MLYQQYIHILNWFSKSCRHTHRFREAAASLQGDQALIRGAKILALMGLELIENKPLLDEIIEEHTHIKGMLSNE